MFQIDFIRPLEAGGDVSGGTGRIVSLEEPIQFKVL